MATASGPPCDVTTFQQEEEEEEDIPQTATIRFDYHHKHYHHHANKHHHHHLRRGDHQRQNYHHQHQTPTSTTTHVVDMVFGASYRKFSHQNVLPALQLEVIKKVGEGGFGKVFLVKDQTGYDDREYAAKIFHFKGGHQTTRTMRNFLKECGILQAIDHDNIVKIITPAVGPKYGVLMFEMFSQGTLHDNLKDISGSLAWKFFCQILYAVEYVHIKRIVHRDIKPQNVLMKGQNVFLSDFGLAQHVPRGKVRGFAGTRRFVAPEVEASRRTKAPVDGFKADAFGVGVLMWCMVLGEAPRVKTRCYKVWTKLVALAGEPDDSPQNFCVTMLLERNPKERVNVLDLTDWLRQRDLVAE